MKIKKVMIFVLLVFICLGTLKAVNITKGYVRCSLGVNITTPVRHALFIDSNLINVSEPINAAPKFESSLMLGIKDGMFVGAGIDYKMFPVKDGRHINALGILSQFGLEFKSNHFNIPLEFGIGPVLYSSNRANSLGLELAMRTGIQRNVGNNILLGINLSSSHLMEFGAYLGNAFITYHMVVEPQMVIGVRW